MVQDSRPVICGPRGGDGWESNPPRTPQQRPANDFEDRRVDRLLPSMNVRWSSFFVLDIPCSSAAAHTRTPSWLSSWLSLTQAVAVLWLSDDVSQRPPHPADHRVHQRLTQRPDWSAKQEVSINRRDLFTESHAVVAQAGRRDHHAGWTSPSGGKDWHDDQIVTHSIPDVLRYNDRGSRLVGVIRLAWYVDVPDLALSRIRRWRSAPSTQDRNSCRLAAARRVACHAAPSRSSALAGSEY